MEKIVLDKTLRNGQRLTLTYTKTRNSMDNGYTAILDGTIVSEGFSAPVRRDCVAGDTDTPHVIEVPNLLKGKAGFAPVGLTTAEADQIEAGKKEVTEQVYEGPDRKPAQQARAAAPDAPTWHTRYTFTAPPAVGSTYREADGRTVTVLHAHSHYTEDGPSFHLGAETGYYYTATIRQATDTEITALEAQEGQEGRLRSARQDLENLFTWNGKTRRGAQEATYEDVHPRDGGVTRLHLGNGRTLTLGDDAIYSTTTPTSNLSPHPYWRHPLTPARAEVFAALAELDPGARLKQPVPRPVGRPRVGRQVTATLPEDVIARLDEIAEQQGRKRGQVLRDIVVGAVQEDGGAGSSDGG